MKFVYLLICLFSLLSQALEPLPWFKGISFNKMEAKLKNGSITKVQSLKDFLVNEKGINWNGTSPYYVGQALLPKRKNR